MIYILNTYNLQSIIFSMHYFCTTERPLFLGNDKANRKKFGKESFLTVNKRPMKVKD